MVTFPRQLGAPTPGLNCRQTLHAGPEEARGFPARAPRGRTHPCLWASQGCGERQGTQGGWCPQAAVAPAEGRPGFLGRLAGRSLQQGPPEKNCASDCWLLCGDGGEGLVPTAGRGPHCRPGREVPAAGFGV